MGNLARHGETLVEKMTPIKRSLPGPRPGPSHQPIPAILVCPDKKPNRLPKRATIDSMISAKSVVTQKQLSKVSIKKKFNFVHR